MKKFLLILSLIPCLLFAQSLEGNGQQIGGKTGLRTNVTLVNIGDNIGLSSPQTKTNFNVRASNFFVAVELAGKTLTTAQKNWYNDSIFVPLYNHGLIGLTRAGDSLVALYSFSLRWAGDSTVANMNLLDPTGSYNCIHYGGVTYTDSGVVSNGTTGYLNAFFIPSSDSGIFKYGSGGFGVYSKTDVAESKDDIGATASTTFLRSRESNYTQARINSTSDVYSGNVVTDGRGITIAVRNSSLVLNIFKNGSNIKSSTNTASGSLSTVPFYICASNSSGTAVNITSKIYPFAVITGGLSATKSQYLSDDLNNALKGAGYNVY